jgi:hypothetical protein
LVGGIKTVTNALKVRKGCMTKRSKRYFSAAREIAQWALVVFLFWPILIMQTARMPLWRMMLGVLLLVIFIGKLFYDYTLAHYEKKSQRPQWVNLLSLVASITMIAVIIGGLLLLFAFYAVSQLQQTPPQE